MMNTPHDLRQLIHCFLFLTTIQSLTKFVNMAFKTVVVLLCALCVLASTMVAAFQPQSSWLANVKLPSTMAPSGGAAGPSTQNGPDLDTLLANNKAWAESKTKNNKNYFKELAKGQAPRYLWIGCSDSRVPAEAMMKVDPGQVFVHRNIANQVVTNDANFMSVLTYAVEHLKVEDIIVCGHYKCGGVAASSSDTDFGPALEDWLVNLRDVFGVNQDLVAGISDEGLQQQRYVDVNAIAQTLKLKAHPTILKAQAANNGIPRIHALVFDMENGLLKNLNAPEPAAASGAETANSAKMTPSKV